MTDDTHSPAAVRYKEITASAETAAQRLTEHESAKTARLDGEIEQARRDVEEADEESERVSKEVDRLWSMAMSALWEERWMRVKPMPEPDSSAKPEKPKKSIGRVESAYKELNKALTKPNWSASSLLPGSRRENRAD